MRIRNPYYVDPVQAEAAPLLDAVRTYLQSRPAKQYIGRAVLVAAVPALGTASRAALNVVLSSLGADIDEAGSDNA